MNAARDAMEPIALAEREAMPERDPRLFDPGFYQIPEEEYRRAFGINKSALDALNVSPLHYLTEKMNPKPDTATFAFGRALHCAILEPERFAKDYAPIPIDAPRRPTARQLSAKKPSAETLYAIEYWRKFDEENKGKILIDADSDPDAGIWGASEWDRIRFMADAVRSHPFASVILGAGGPNEISCFWFDEEIPVLCKCRFDHICDGHEIAVDIKKTRSAAASDFARSVHDYRYHVQARYYLDGAWSAGRRLRKFVFVAVEDQPPYAVACYTLPAEWLRQARLIIENDLRLYKACKDSGRWPGYAHEVNGGIRELEMPGYAKFVPFS